MKRTLLVWPLAASLFTTGLCWVSLQADPGSRLLIASVSQLWMDVGLASNGPGDRGPVPAPQRISLDAAQIHVAVKPDSKKSYSPVVTDPVAADRSTGSVWDELAQLSDWNEDSLVISKPKVIGVPAAKFEQEPDLFGFDDLAHMASQRLGESEVDSLPTLELTPPAETVVEVDLDHPIASNSNEIVIKIDPNLFFADQSPLSENEPDDLIDAGATRLAERPSSEIELPTNYEAPSPVVADLTPEFASAESVPSGESTEALLGSNDRLEDSLLSQNAVEPQAITQAQPEIPEVKRESVESAEDSDSTSRDLAPARATTWPVAKRLMDQLDELDEVVRREQSLDLTSHAGDLSVSDQAISNAELLAWTARVRNVLDLLHQSDRLGDEGVRPVLDELTRSHEFAYRNVNSLQSRELQIAWLHTAYSIERRVAIWGPIYQINSGDDPAAQHVGDDVLSVSKAVGQLAESLETTGDHSGWRQFLLLSELQSAFANGSDKQRREIAQKFLSRLNWPTLAPEHRDWLNTDPVQSVASAMRPWASGAIDYAVLLRQIEKAESNALDLATTEVAQSMQSLQYAGHPQAKRLATNLDTHYRNANVRFSISEELLRELLPKIPTKQVPVRTTMLGSRVTGISRVSSELQLKLLPSPATWEMTLQTIGNVSTQSVGRRGPAAVSTSSVNPFSASMPISIKPSDIKLGNASVNVGGRARLRDINTTYDTWPLIGTLVQSIAESEYREKSSLANRIGRNRIRTQVTEEIDRTMNDKVSVASDRFTKTVLGPLTSLKLQPQVVDMNSTASRLTARYRMAGDWQLAAMTPRPRAYSDNLMSVQFHQSSINNTLEQLVPQNKLMPIEDVLTQCFDLVGTELTLPEDLPDGISIQFAKHRPVTVEIEDQRVWITMRIIRLEREDRLKLRNFIVRASYKTQVDGLSASLVRDGHLSISGPGMSMRQRFPVRAIFNKVLSPNRPLVLTSPELLENRVPAGTVISQFELRDGWVGIALGKASESALVAVGTETQASGTSR